MDRRQLPLAVVQRLGWPVRAGVEFATGTVRLVRAAPAFPGALSEVPGLLHDAREAMQRVQAMVTQAEQVAHQASLIAQHVDRVARQADDVRQQAEDLVGGARELLDGVAPVARAAARRVEVLTDLVDALGDVDPGTVRSLARVADRLGPLLEKIAGSDSAIAEDTTALVRQLPGLLDQLDSSVIPALDEMRQAVPDVRAILPLVEKLGPVLVDVETRIAGLPGSGRLRRRGQKEIAEAVDVDVSPREVDPPPAAASDQPSESS